jgi:phosphatidate cytidylyltransferase
VTELEQTKKKSDLSVRAASALVMMIVSGGALWAGGIVFTLFAALLAIGLLWEYWGLVQKLVSTAPWRAALMALGMVYIAVACWALVELRKNDFLDGLSMALFVIGLVIAVDIGAYFAGRSIGGPKIAPRISPNKTWAGLLGGIAAATIVIALVMSQLVAKGPPFLQALQLAAPIGAGIAVVAQAGDFLESWMKRRAGVKDSGKLIPGHGGLLDRLDGHLAVLFVLGAMELVS